jgi:hypothetical protein
MRVTTKVTAGLYQGVCANGVARAKGGAQQTLLIAMHRDLVLTFNGIELPLSALAYQLTNSALPSFPATLLFKYDADVQTGLAS